jgi:hypothetical protein
MDYKIKFEYKGIGKQASATRNKVLQAQKNIEKRSAGTGMGEIKTLNASINKLIASNKELARTINRNITPGTGAGGAVGAGVTRAGISGISRGGMSGLAALGVAGFAIQKINQIGNAYIEKTSQQIGTVGIGGFQRGRGVYQAAQMGAGMKSFGMATGRFGGKGVRPGRAALDIGAIYGLSPEEVFGTAGKFRRAGAKYEESADIAMGAGVQTELPQLLQGMSNILTDAIREGINTSDMSSDMAKNIAMLSRQTPAQSVEAALNIVQGFKGGMQQVAQGKMGGMQQLYTAQAGQQLLMKKLQGPGRGDFIKRLEQEGSISKQQADLMRGMGPKATFQNLQTQIGGAGAFSLLRKQAAESDPTEILKEVMSIAKKQYGAGAEGFQRFSGVAAAQGWSVSQEQLRAAWNMKELTPDESKAMTARGRGMRRTRAESVEKGKAGLGVQRAITRENLILDYGAKFADTSLAMEKSMMNLARTVAPAASTALNSLASAADGVTKIFEKIKSTKITVGGGTDFMYEY